MLDAEKSGDYLRVSSERQPAPDARSSKGKTTDSDSVNRGSNPRRASTIFTLESDAYGSKEGDRPPFPCCILFPRFSAIFSRFPSVPGGSVQHGCDMKQNLSK